MNVHIEINSEDGITSKVIVNGTDISDYVSSVEYLHTGGKFPTVRLTFISDYVRINSCNATVKLPERVLSVLERTQREDFPTENFPYEQA